MRKVLFWIVWNIPLEKLALHIFGLAIGRKGKKLSIPRDISGEEK